MKQNQNVLRYEEAASVLPLRLRKAALALPEDRRSLAEEFRLRAGWFASLTRYSPSVRDIFALQMRY